jgi:hypothetical protein
MSSCVSRLPFFDGVSAIGFGKFDCNLRVRVVRRWEVPDVRLSGNIDSLEMILVDERVGSSDRCSLVSFGIYVVFYLYFGFRWFNVMDIAILRVTEFRQQW